MLTFTQVSPVIGATGGLQQNVTIDNSPGNDSSTDPFGGSLSNYSLTSQGVIPPATTPSSSNDLSSLGPWILLLASAYFAWEWLKGA